MRFSRDRRGYENTFVLHGERRRGKGRARLLYWFRTPPEVKVGRSALDEEAIRLIEELNPDIDFDWTRILKGDGPTEESRPPERSRAQGPPPKARRRSDQFRERVPPVVPERRAPRDSEAPTKVAYVPQPAALEAAGLDPVIQQQPEFSAPPPTPAHERLGGEGVARLRGRYAEVMARIAERVTDEVRRDELKSLAERLNPDNWVTDEEVKAGLEEYEGVFASLRAAVGTRKRRRRRRGRTGSPGNQAETADGHGELVTEPDAGPEQDAELPEKDGDADDL
jgi:hypothetical protein